MNELLKITQELSWPSTDVQEEWKRLASYLDNPAYLCNKVFDDQPMLMEIVIANGIGPLLYNQLKAGGCLQSLSENVLERLQQIYFLTAAFNLLLSSEIRALVNEFDRAKIPVLWVKGAILAANLYEDLALRPAGDLDLIVRSEHVNRAEEVIKGLGYVLASPEAFGDFNKEVGHARAYQRRDNKAFTLELHHALMSSIERVTPINETWFWDHTTQVSINGASLLTLNQEANLLYLCGHLVSHHGWEPRFIWLYDVHRLLEKYKEVFDWELLNNLVDELNWGPYVSCVLKAAWTFLHTSIPGAFLAKFGRDEQKSPVLNWQTRLPPTRAIRTLADWRRIPSLSNRMRFLYHVFFPTRTYMVYRYQPADQRTWPLLYPYRWGIMLKEGIQTLWSLCRQKGTRQGL